MRNLLKPNFLSIFSVALLFLNSNTVYGDNPLPDENSFQFIRGDANSDGGIDVTDVLASLTCQFRGQDCPDCPGILDANDDGFLDISDPSFLLYYLFQGGPPPAMPFPGAGLDPTPDEISCDENNESPLEITVDPDLDINNGLDIEALRDEGAGTGRLALADGDILEGRIVREGIYVPDDATVYVMEGTELFLTEESYIGGSLVPIAESDTVEPGAEEDEENEEDDSPVGDGAGAAEPRKLTIGNVLNCGQVTRNQYQEGTHFRSIAFNQIGSLVISNFPCDGVRGLPGRKFARWKERQHAPAVNINGNRSVRAKGGNGGDGRNIEIRCSGMNATLTIRGMICNSPGGDGGDATGTGADGTGCGECGGGAWAIGGKGGRSGNLLISAQTIIWDNEDDVVLEVYPGGKGGNAIARGGAGGNCNLCGVNGGPGGDAAAFAGRAGIGGKVTIRANQMINTNRQTMEPSDLLERTTLHSPAPGGDADATAGNGGKGGDCLVCTEDGGNGGPGGNAYSEGGKGASGRHGVAFKKKPGITYPTTTATKASDGSQGGNARSEAGTGGDGGHVVNPCPCTDTVQAGNGGSGGTGGDADSVGGEGGSARRGYEPQHPKPRTGNGGDAFSICGNGGKGGNGGSCIGGWPNPCVPGNSGHGGSAGTNRGEGGERGGARGNVFLGLRGSYSPTVCVIGIDGNPGLKDCTEPPPLLIPACIPILRDSMARAVPQPWLQELERMLNQVEELLAEEQIDQAVSQLDFLIQEIFRLMESSQIPGDQAVPLIEQAERCLQELILMLGGDVLPPVILDLQNLREAVNENVPQPLIPQLERNLDQAENFLAQGQVEQAAVELEFFLQGIFELIEGEQIPLEQADFLINLAEWHLQQLILILKGEEIPVELEEIPLLPPPNPPWPGEGDIPGDFGLPLLPPPELKGLGR